MNRHPPTGRQEGTMYCKTCGYDVHEGCCEGWTQRACRRRPSGDGLATSTGRRTWRLPHSGNSSACLIGSAILNPNGVSPWLDRLRMPRSPRSRIPLLTDRGPCVQPGRYARARAVEYDDEGEPAMEVADKAVPEDLPRIGSALGQAFSDDPLFVWAIQDDDRRQRFELEFFTLYAKAFLRHDETYTTRGEVVAAALWAPPGAEPVSGEDAEELGRLVEELAGPDAS